MFLLLSRCMHAALAGCLAAVNFIGEGVGYARLYHKNTRVYGKHHKRDPYLQQLRRRSVQQ